MISGKVGIEYKWVLNINRVDDPTAKIVSRGKI